jgi:hypothetical protein
MLGSDTSDKEPDSLVKLPSVSRSPLVSPNQDLTDAQIEIIKQAPPLILTVKFSDMKFREGKRTFSFSTKIAKMPKLFGEKKNSDASDSYFEFMGGETP